MVYVIEVATPSEIGAANSDKMYVGTGGVVLAGEVLDGLILRDFSGGGGPAGLAIITTQYDNDSAAGSAHEIRLNVNDTDNGHGYGQFPWVSVTLSDPRDPADADYAGTKFAWYKKVLPGDFNGDGYPDFMLTQKEISGSLLLY